MQNGPVHWRPKPWGQHLGTRAQPGGMSSRPRGPLPSNARGEKSVPQNGRFSAASGKQFRSLADRWRFSAIGHAGSASCKVSAGAYLFFCSHTALCSEWSRGKERYAICPASSKNGPRDPRSNQCRSLDDSLTTTSRPSVVSSRTTRHARCSAPASPRARLARMAAAASMPRSSVARKACLSGSSLC